MWCARTARVGWLIAVVVAVLLTAPGAAGAATPRSFFGVTLDGGLLSAEPAVRDRGWNLAAGSGAGSVRVVFSWARARPSPEGPTDFAATDEVVEAASRRGLAVLPVVMDTPPWARRVPERGSSAPAREGDYTDHLRALVGRYGPAGSFWAERPGLARRPLREWQIWNEPELGRYWYDPDGTPLRSYGRLLRAAHAALRDADPGAKVVLAGLTNASWVTLARLQVEGDIGGHFDAAAYQTYTGTPRDWLSGIKRFRRALRRDGDGRVPIWVTEFGWPAAERRTRNTVPSIDTTDAGMARRVRDAYTLLARERRSSTVGVARAYWYTFASSYTRGEEFFDFAGLMRYVDGRLSARPALRAYRDTVRRLRR
jgi:hypothetical protein